jgi:dienelactone hydrolase
MRRAALALVLLVAVVAGCVATRPSADVALEPSLWPTDALYLPAGQGPFPAVVVLSGCLGVRSKDARWAERLRDRGYAVLVPDSFTGRGLATLEQRRDVCRGLTLWGGTRAADVRASLAHLRTLPQVDPSRMAAIGFSHGAWAALELLAIASDDDVRGLRAVIGFYPYCGVISRARWFGWRVDVPTLLLLAGDDRMVSAPQCQSVAEREAADGRRVVFTVYPDAGHGFDWRTSPATEDAQRRVDAFLAEHLAPTVRREAGAVTRP